MTTRSHLAKAKRLQALKSLTDLTIYDSYPWGSFLCDDDVTVVCFGVIRWD